MVAIFFSRVDIYYSLIGKYVTKCCVFILNFYCLIVHLPHIAKRKLDEPPIKGNQL